jgi:hypothetical protein
VRVRTFELRLVAVGLTALWFLAAMYVVLGYRPGGPIDGLVGAAAGLPMAIALAAVVWPPVTRGDRAFALIVWLGLAAGLLLVPSIGGVLNQLLARGPQTLLPSLEAAYPWLLALVATSLFAGLGIARRSLGGTALRRARLVRAALIGVGLAVGAGATFASAAIANDLALRDRPSLSSRFGPTAGDIQPPLCDQPLLAGTGADLDLHLSADVDGRPVGAVGLVGERAGTDVRWTADVASSVELGRYGVARVGSKAWTRGPRQGWLSAPPSTADDELVDVQVLASALADGVRATAEDRGLEFVEGARSRHCRVAVDGPTFVAAFPQVRWLVADDTTLHRWRGQLDYWVFGDDELGRLTGSVNGAADTLGSPGIQGTIRIQLTATNRHAARSIVPPVG